MDKFVFKAFHWTISDHANAIIGTNAFSFFVGVIPQVAATSCSSCTPSEKMNFGKIVKHVQTYYPRVS
jgi:hypothetical protein